MASKRNKQRDNDTVVELPVATPATEKLHNELGVLNDAGSRVALLRIPMDETSQVCDDIHAYAAANNLQFYIHMATHGLNKIPTENATGDPEPCELVKIKVNKSTCGYTAAFAEMQSDKFPADDVVVAFLHLYFSFEEPACIMSLQMQVEHSIVKGQQTIIVVPDHMPISDSVLKLVNVIDYEYPTNEELAELWDDCLKLIDTTEEKVGVTATHRMEILRSATGMTRFAFDAVISRAFVEHGTEESGTDGIGGDVFIKALQRERMAQLKKTDMLELLPPVSIEDVGGAEQFKIWAQERAYTFTAEAAAKGIRPSKGCFMVGPPGGGKSLLAKAIGDLLGLPVIRLDIGKLFGGLVGQSESQTRMVLAFLDAMSPLVLMVDEIDKGFAGVNGSNDSGTSSRVFGTILSWLQERDQMNSPIFAMATANRVGGLPAELSRRGRFDAIFSMTTPNRVERLSIFDIHCHKRNVDPMDYDRDKIASEIEGLMGSEIEGLVEESVIRCAMRDDDVQFTIDDLKSERGLITPITVTYADQMKEMVEWATDKARPVALVDQAVPDNTNKGKRLKLTGKRRLKT